MARVQKYKVGCSKSKGVNEEKTFTGVLSKSAAIVKVHVFSNTLPWMLL